MQSIKLYPAIMCGGSGTRLWPLSRNDFPKQFISLVNNTSMLQDTIERLPTHCQKPIFICNEAHRFTVAEQVHALGESGKILLEPVGKNTAPAIALAAFEALKSDENAVMLVLAADHVIKNQEAFHSAVSTAQVAALNDKLVTFGIVPDKPETGYGYIKYQPMADGQVSSVEEFVEKPDLETATRYLDSKQYLWNSGMFMFKASVYLKELKQFSPEIYNACQQAISDSADDLDFIRPSADSFNESPSDSIDYAVMEKTSDAVVVPLDAGWSDVGSYSALWEVSPQDENGNVCQGDVITHDSHNSFLYSQNKLIASIGIDDIVVIDTPDAVMVADKSRVQEVKEVVNKLKAEKRSEVTHHREVYRPWGSYDSIDMGERFQVKRIVVKPGAKLSVQMHHHRAEHWIVVSGTAKVTVDDDTFLMTENESTYIPIGAVHALENPGKLPLEMIEVQSGSYLGEDDIVRFEDRYGRAEK